MNYSILFSPTLGFQVSEEYPTTNFNKQLNRFSKLEQAYILTKGKKRLKKFKKEKNVKRWVRKGIPNVHRGWVWALLAELEEDIIREWNDRRVGMSDGEISLATQIAFGKQSISQSANLVNLNDTTSRNTKKYLYLLKRQVSCKNTKQIDMDIDRTFPEHPFFSLDSTKEAMRRILYAYQIYNPRVGYCQAMNFQAGVLLLIYQDEEITFHMLAKILGDFLPQDLYDNSMLGVHQDCYVLERLVKKRLPRLYQHLKEKLDIHFSLFGANWFLCLCLNDYPVETSLRIWDAFFNEGYKIIFRVAVAVLQQLEKELLKCQSDGEVLMSVRKYASSLYDCKSFMKEIFALPNFPKGKIIKFRKEFRKKIEEKV